MRKRSNVKNDYLSYLRELTVKPIRVKLAIVFFIVGYFIFSDLYFRNNINAFFTRLIPISIAVVLVVLEIFARERTVLKSFFFNVLLAGLLFMMYGKCLVHLHDALDSSIVGTVLVMFLVSLDLKTSIRNSALIFFGPSLVFVFVLLVFFKPTREELISLTNILPIVIFGFIANILQNRLRYNEYEKKILLEKEKETTLNLLEAAKENNKILSEKNAEIEAQAQALFENQNQLSELNKEKDKLLSVISHDLRSPFGAIIGLSEITHEELLNKDYSNLDDYCININTSATRALNLLDNLLQWKTIRSSSITLEFQIIDINSIIENVLKLLNSNFLVKNITCDFNSLYPVMARIDALTMEIVIRNLVSNAIKFTKRGGKVSISCVKEENRVRISVTDTGVGMKEEKLNKLFSPDQINSSLGTDNESGSGYGLMLCKEFIDRHNGNITVKSKIGEGTTFNISIPV